MNALRVLPAVALALTLAHAPQAHAADDTIILTGCVATTPTGGAGVSGPSLLVWSVGNAMLTDASVQYQTGRAVGTAGQVVAPVIYWIDDEDDVNKYAGHRVEVVGEMKREFDKGELEIEEKDGFAEIELDFDGDEAKARIPLWMFAGRDVDDVDFDVLVRKIDVEKVNVLSAPCR